jgi:hypothetical protein
MKFVYHRKHTYTPSRPVTGIILLFYLWMVFVPHRKQPVTEIALLVSLFIVWRILLISVGISENVQSNKFKSWNWETEADVLSLTRRSVQILFIVRALDFHLLCVSGMSIALARGTPTRHSRPRGNVEFQVVPY